MAGLASDPREADACGMSTAIEHPSSRRLVLTLATVLLGPGTLFVAANVLEHGIGLEGAAAWFDSLLNLPGVSWIVTSFILGGPVVALLLAGSRLLPIRLERDGDAWEVRIRVSADGWAIAVVAASVVVGVILAGHLIAENMACVIGLRPYC
jgi:hypothetical protein